VKTVAFLQDIWDRDPDKVRRMLACDRTGKLREKLVKYALFAGCLTGRRLRAAFRSLCDEVVWEDAGPAVCGSPDVYCPPDRAHILAVLDRHRPDVVLCFTRCGQDAVEAACRAWGGPTPVFIAALHPAARGADTVQGLLDAAARLRAVKEGFSSSSHPEREQKERGGSR
jgi:hypothetical protein